MPIYEEMMIDKKTGGKKAKIVDGKKQYYIRTYIEDEFGNSKQVTRHNKHWLGNQGKLKASQEEIRLKSQQVIQTHQELKLTLNEAKNKYIEHETNRVDPDTIKSKKTKLVHFCDEDKTNQVKTYPNIQVKMITKQFYEEWQRQMKHKKYEKGKNIWHAYSVKRLNKIHDEICLMFDYLLENGYCTSNVPRQVGKIGTTKEVKLSKQNKKYTTIDYDEYLKLMKATKQDKKYNTIFDLFFSRGVRIGEMRAFRILDFNYEENQIMVNHTLSKENVLKEPKTASSKAPIDLDDELNEKINNLILELKTQPNFNDKWYIFNGATPISAHAIDYNKNKYFELAKIKKNIKLHDFRHSCATWLFSIGIPIAVISKILRHADVGITLSTYTHLVQKDYEEALDRLNKIKQDQKQDQKK